MSTQLTDPLEMPTAADIEALFSQHCVEDPYPFYRRLQQTVPVCRTPYGRWMVSRHRDAVALLADPRCAHWGQGGSQGKDSAHGSEFALSTVLRALAPGGDTRYRKAAAESFGGGESDELTLRADHLLEKLRGRAEIDLVTDFAHPYTFGAVCSLLGVPDDDSAALCDLVARLDGGYLQLITTAVASDSDPEDDGAVLIAALTELLAKKRRQPEDDLSSRLVAAAASTGMADQQADQFLIHLVLLLIYAGHQNMMNFLGLAMLTLARQPSLTSSLRGAPERAADAVLELMRYDSPVQYLPLIAQDTLVLEGQAISAGEEILLCVGAANRDPEAFVNPESVDFSRRPRQQLSFGSGPHRCIGAQLAIRQGAAALNSLVTHLEDFDVVEPALSWRTQPMVQRGLRALPLHVKWS